MREELRNRLKRFRIQSRMKWKDILPKAGCSRQQIARIEDGESEPTLGILEDIVSVYGLTLVDFLLGKEPVREDNRRSAERAELPQRNYGRREYDHPMWASTTPEERKLLQAALDVLHSNHSTTKEALEACLKTFHMTIQYVPPSPVDDSDEGDGVVELY